ncbi:LPS assembly lipoprotein LptE [Alphaproteobacteria bacterium]|nr:LPS assembly lipoprotein LptE [Alphaproteobacteria bacterium]
MSLFSKFLYFGSTLWLLAGCGFEPLYGAKGQSVRVDAALNEISIKPIKGRSGQQLYNHLLDQLNPRGVPAHPRYVLVVTASVNKISLGIKRDETATRAKLSLSSNFKLHGSSNNAVVFYGYSQSTNSYNIVDSEFTTLSAEKDAIDRAARVVSENIKIRLALYLNRIGHAQR